LPEIAIRLAFAVTSLAIFCFRAASIALSSLFLPDQKGVGNQMICIFGKSRCCFAPSPPDRRKPQQALISLRFFKGSDRLQKELMEEKMAPTGLNNKIYAYVI